MVHPALPVVANYKAIVDRLTTFGEAIVKAQDLQAKSGIKLPSQPSADLTIPTLSLAIPSGETIATVRDLTLRPGETTLVTGPSGSGKSTLFRAVAGIWPFGAGEIRVPEGKSVMLLPQRPYLPMGTLREAVQYPDWPATIRMARSRRRWRRPVCRSSPAGSTRRRPGRRPYRSASSSASRSPARSSRSRTGSSSTRRPPRSTRPPRRRSTRCSRRSCRAPPSSPSATARR